MYKHIKKIKLIKRKRDKEKRIIQHINSWWHHWNIRSVERLKKSRTNVSFAKGKDLIRHDRVDLRNEPYHQHQRRILCRILLALSEHLYKKVTVGMWSATKEKHHHVRRDMEESGDRQSAKPLVSRYKQSQFPVSVRAAGKDFVCSTTKRQYSALRSRDRVGIERKLRW